MIFAFSTSSRLASVAVLDENGKLLWSGSMDAPQSSGSACMTLLAQAKTEADIDVQDGTGFVSDVGPGSFTGVRVGVVMAKTFGYVLGRLCAAIDAFDLVASDQCVVLPLKRGEYFVRKPGIRVYSTTELPTDPCVGYGPAEWTPTFPDASRARLENLIWKRAEELVPAYLVEPSISVSKRPIPGATA